MHKHLNSYAYHKDYLYSRHVSRHQNRPLPLRWFAGRQARPPTGRPFFSAIRIADASLRFQFASAMEHAAGSPPRMTGNAAFAQRLTVLR
jgi:hypothetical protein